MALETEARAGGHCQIWKSDPRPGCRLFLQQPLSPDTLPTPLTYPPPYTLLPPVGFLSLSASGCLVSFTPCSLSLSCWKPAGKMSMECSLNLCGLFAVDVSTKTEKSPGPPDTPEGCFLRAKIRGAVCKHFKHWP